MSMVGPSIATINVHDYQTGWGQTEDGFTSDVLQETMVGLQHWMTYSFRWTLAAPTAHKPPTPLLMTRSCAPKDLPLGCAR